MSILAEIKKKILPGIAKCVRFFTEIMRWVIIALSIYLIIFFISEILYTSIVTDKAMQQTVNIVMGFILWVGIIGGIQKIQSIPKLIILLLSLFALSFYKQEIVKLPFRIKTWITKGMELSQLL